LSTPCRILLILALLLAALPAVAEVLPGVEVLRRDHAGELRGLRVGVLTNPTGVTRDLESTIDVLRGLPGVEVRRLFAPEHGLRGTYFAGDKVSGRVDPVSGLPVVSLYGAQRTPPAESLADLDVVLYDIQDVGHRTYTFVSTLTRLMEACEAAGVAVWVLDRPEPLGGTTVGGPMLDAGLESFIGIHDVPHLYGMTPGEWARMIRAERTPELELRVIPMDGWRRGMLYGELDWPWVPPSQHIPTWQSSAYYAMTGTIGSLQRVSEGVGTALPFQLIGAPWLDARAFAATLNARGLDGVRFRATSFTPRYGTGSGELQHGVQIHVRDFRAVNPAEVLLALMGELARAAPEQGLFTATENDAGRPTNYLLALGSRRLAAVLADNGDPQSLRAVIARDLAAFAERRARYLIYR
jgi:uncharacterized protein YbbC (DUF1343 family)